MLRVAAMVACTESEGPHRRFALWVQGCTLRCPGCCNPEMFDAQGGSSIPIDDLLERIDQARRDHEIEGLTVLGGEPLQQLQPLVELCRTVRALGLGLVVFTGYRLEQARRLPGWPALLRRVDTLIDGPYDPRHPEPPTGRRFIGSQNQRILHASLRYADPALWKGRPQAEVRLHADGSLDVLGFPRPVRRLLRRLRSSSGDPTQ